MAFTEQGLITKRLALTWNCWLWKEIGRQSPSLLGDPPFTIMQQVPEGQVSTSEAREGQVVVTFDGGTEKRTPFTRAKQGER